MTINITQTKMSHGNARGKLVPVYTSVLNTSKAIKAQNLDLLIADKINVNQLKELVLSNCIFI